MYKLDPLNYHTAKRIEKVLAWTAPRIHLESIGISRKQIREVFGNCQSNPLSEFLFGILFTRDPHSTYNNPAFKGGEAEVYEYFPNLAGWMWLKEVHETKIVPTKRFFSTFGTAVEFWRTARATVTEVVSNCNAEELESGVFNYKDSDCGRKYHSLQQLPKAGNVRTEFWLANGMEWDCDMDNAQMRVLKQFADKQGISVPGIDEYIANKKAVRNEINVAAHCMPAQSKTLLAAIGNGMIWSQHNVKSIIGEYGAKRVHQMPLLAKIAGEVMVLQAMLPDDHFYFKVERQVMDCAERYLKSKGVKSFNMFDGCITSECVDELADVIAEETGWHVLFTWEKLVVTGLDDDSKAAKMIRDVNRLTELIDAPVEWEARDVGYGYQVKVAKRGTVTRADAANLRKTLRKAVAEEARRKNIEWAQNVTKEELEELLK